MSLLEDEMIAENERQRAVLKLNERIFKRCCEDRCFQAVHRKYDIDPFDAVLDDERLPDGFSEKRYPQMRKRLASIRD